MHIKWKFNIWGRRNGNYSFCKCDYGFYYKYNNYYSFKKPLNFGFNVRKIITNTIYTIFISWLPNYCKKVF